MSIPQRKDLDKHHRSKVLRYCHSRLEAQPWRLSAQGNLTDMYTLEEFRAIRQEDGSFMSYQAMPISLAEPGTEAFAFNCGNCQC